MRFTIRQLLTGGDFCGSRIVCNLSALAKAVWKAQAMIWSTSAVVKVGTLSDTMVILLAWNFDGGAALGREGFKCLKLVPANGVVGFASIEVDCFSSGGWVIVVRLGCPVQKFLAWCVVASQVRVVPPIWVNVLACKDLAGKVGGSLVIDN